MTSNVRLGYAVGSGEPVMLPMHHMVITGQTQLAGKTTALEALIERAGVQAIAFVTKRGEGSFANARTIEPYFREQADWQFVASILEASRGEKLKFERAWIIRASKGASTLADVQRNVRKLMATAKGMSADVYLTLDAYLEAVVPQISQVRWAPTVKLAAGLSVMDLTALNVEMQHLVIRSTIDWVLHNATNTVVVVPEAWKFIPQGRGTPVKLAAESYIRQAAGLKNYLWLDSQDIAGVEKIILKSVPIWILGVQRESNEIKRTLAQIPAGIRKPKPEQIATLGLGQFFACHGTQVEHTYVQPTWISEKDAQLIAQGKARVHPPEPAKEKSVTEAEAKTLREDNARLRGELAAALRRLNDREGERLSVAAAPKPESSSEYAVRAEFVGADASPRTPVPFESHMDEDFYQQVKARLIEEAPDILRVAIAKPELRVEITRETITVDGKGTRGRIARLIADEFFSKSRTSAEVLAELEKRGSKPSNIELGNELKALTEMGFFTRENKWYSLVAGSVVNVVER